MKICVAGGGAFGTALAQSLAQDGRNVSLWVRDAQAAASMQHNRINPKLPGVSLLEPISVVSDSTNLAQADVILLAIPTQALPTFLESNTTFLKNKDMIACCKGIDLHSLTGPTATISHHVPTARTAMLTGPSFAADIARGLPTALTLASQSDGAEALQNLLSTQNLRIYRTRDVIGAELGGALKNVIAIGCGVTIGAGLGDSARAALMTRGFAEMQRLAEIMGADPQTLAGLSGLGDLALTCTSTLSRNFTHGIALGKASKTDPNKTIEGVATASAVRQIAAQRNIDLPVCSVIAKICATEISVPEALQLLLARPLKEE